MERRKRESPTCQKDEAFVFVFTIENKNSSVVHLQESLAEQKVDGINAEESAFVI